MPTPRRERAAVTLAALTALAVIGLTVGTYITSVRRGTGLDETSVQLLLIIFGALIGLVSGWLVASRDPGYTARDWVGAIMTVALGLSALMIVLFVIRDSVISTGPALSANTANLLSTVLGGTIGSLAAYLGLGTTAPRDPEPPPPNHDELTQLLDEPPAGDDEVPPT